jgi:hypothetical protein
MITAETQRTLVKSPPELWGELGDQSALARHLAALGEIRIVASKPEQSVEWEAEAAHGKIEIKPAGWGTKVTLSATVDGDSRTVDGAEQTSSASNGEPDGDFQSPPDTESRAEPDPEVQVEVDPEVQVEADPEVQVDPNAEPNGRDPAPSHDRAGSRLFSRVRWRGWFARRRRGAADARGQELPSQPGDAPTVAEPEPVRSPDPEPVRSPEPESTRSPEPTRSPGSEPTSSPEPETASPPEIERERDCAVQPEDASYEQQALERTTELLRGVLDSLGEAHHRPFSRA